MSSIVNPQKPPQMHGIVVLDKPSGPSSAQCLSVFKRQGQRKIGHAGTLDPMASGVLTVLLGNATKLSSYIMEGGRKIYSGIIRLGVETDTWDMEGQIVAEKPTDGITAEIVAQAIAGWTDLTEQEAPAFSALKHNGQPLYKLARKGRDTPKKIRKINIYESGMLSFDMPCVGFRAACGSGTYIRSLAHSLGKRLGCGAALAALKREYSHPFHIGQAVAYEDIKAGLEPGHALPLTAAMPHWPLVNLSASQADDVRHGRPAPAGLGDDEYAFLCENGEAIAIARKETGRDGKNKWLVERGLWAGGDQSGA